MSCPQVLPLPAFSYTEAYRSANEVPDCYELTDAATHSGKLNNEGNTASSSKPHVANFNQDVKPIRAFGITRRSLDRAAKKRDTCFKKGRRKHRIDPNKRPRILQSSQQVKFDPDADRSVEKPEDCVTLFDKEWVSVPVVLNKKDAVKGDDEEQRENPSGEQIDSEAVLDKEAVEQVKVKELDVKPYPVITETEHQFLHRISSILQGSAEIIKRNVQAEIYDTSVYHQLRELKSSAKRLLEEAEECMRLIREQELKKKYTAEKEELEASMAAEKLQLLQKIDNLELENREVINEKLNIERERDSMRTDFEGKLQKARESVRDDLEKQYAVNEESFRQELAFEQEKTCCQICFASPRDALILPCLHFQYCNECLQTHQLRNKECPTCRTMISGVLRCALTPS